MLCLGFADILETGEEFDCAILSRDISLRNDFPVIKPEIAKDSSTDIFATCDDDDAKSFLGSFCDATSAKVYFNTFCKMQFSIFGAPSPSPLPQYTQNNLISSDEKLQEPASASNISYISYQLKCISPPTSFIVVIPQTKCHKSRNLIVFQKQVCGFIILTLKLHNCPYYVHIQ